MINCFFNKYFANSRGQPLWTGCEKKNSKYQSADLLCPEHVWIQEVLWTVGGAPDCPEETFHSFFS